MTGRRHISTIARGVVLIALGLAARGFAGEHDIPGVLAAVRDSSMRADILGLQQFGTRYALAANHPDVAVWLVSRFRAAGLTEVSVDSFPLGETWQRNVVGLIRGRSVPGTEIVVGAHYDSYSRDLALAPGADDNASGVSAVLETARALINGGAVTSVNIRFIVFAAEELGLLGSADYARKARARNDDIAAMLNFDMIGHRRADQPDRHVNVVWYAGHESLARLDTQVTRRYTTLEPRLTSGGRNASDSYSFAREGYPAVFVIEADFNPFYHSPADLLDTLDLVYAADIVRAQLALLLTLDSQIDSTRGIPQVPPGGYLLLPNYPNPFNGGTTIAFSLGSPAVVRLTVHTLLGQEVAILADGAFGAGVFTRWWNAAGHASGVYFARLHTGSTSQTSRLLLVR